MCQDQFVAAETVEQTPSRLRVWSAPPRSRRRAVARRLSPSRPTPVPRRPRPSAPSSDPGGGPIRSNRGRSVTKPPQYCLLLSNYMPRAGGVTSAGDRESLHYSSPLRFERDRSRRGRSAEYVDLQRARSFDGRHSGVSRVSLRPGPRRVAVRRGGAAVRRGRPGPAAEALPAERLQRHPPRTGPRRAGRHRDREPLRPREPDTEGVGQRQRPAPGHRPLALHLRAGIRRSRGRPTRGAGFFARVRLEPFGKGKIFAHEQTMAGPKEDRLKLYRATGFNLSPIFCLYPDPEGEVARVLDPFTLKGPPLVAKDHLGVTNRLWAVSDTQHGQHRGRPHGPEAGLHRRRPPPLRNRPQVPRGTQGGRRGARRRSARQLHPDDARRHERPGSGHPSHAPAHRRPRAP